MDWIEKTDVLVIGSGLAGCVAAICAADQGARVALITRESDPEKTNTSYAQGGVIYRARQGDPELLVNDILEAGAGLSLRPACELLAREGPPLVKEILIDRFQVPFDRDSAGQLDLTEEGGHSQPRIVHVLDITGRSIQKHCLDAVKRTPGITLVPDATAVDLLLESRHSTDPLDLYNTPRCIGAYVLQQSSGKVYPILAPETVLATGGLGQLFQHTTNPRGARGDGIAIAYRAGARMLNLEYVQFHPTVLYHPESKGFLISEAVRGEGGVLERKNGERFMEAFHPLGSLAPRDVVARAIHDVLIQYDEQCVFIDLTHKEPDWIRKRFPNIHARCLALGIDITRQKIPVVPAAHYACGGVAVDAEGRSSIPGLRAVGEVTCTGVHGANRLASTSLLEALLWGQTAGRAAGIASKNPHGNVPEVRAWEPETEDIDPALILQDWNTIKYTMWNYVGLARTPKRLRRAKQILRELQMEIDDFYARARLTDDMVGLRNGVQSALAVLYAAMANHRSRGCHYLIADG